MKGATPAITELLRAGVAFTPWEYAHDPAATSFGAEAAAALGRDPDQVFKTLVVAAHPAARQLALALVPVSASVNLKQMATAMGVKKVAMAPVEVAERATGYVAGGISPLGQRRRLPTYIDVSAKTWDTILISGGQRGLDVELAPSDLTRLTSARYLPIR